MDSINKINTGILVNQQNKTTTPWANLKSQPGTNVAANPISVPIEHSFDYRKNRSLAAAIADFLMGLGGILLIHSYRKITRGIFWGGAVASALYAAIHYRITANTPGKMIVDWFSGKNHK